MDNNEDRSKYKDSSGTGVLSAIIFFVLMMVAMFLISKYMG